MTNEEVEAKRIKLTAGSKTDPKVGCNETGLGQKIKAILADEYYKPLKRCFVYTGTLNDAKLISKSMSELCRLVQLNELNHLKRVNKLQLILCSLNEILKFLQESSEDKSIQPLLSSLSSPPTEDDLRRSNEEFTISILNDYLTKCGVSSDLIKSLTENVKIAQVASIPPTLSWQCAEANTDWPCKFHPNKDMDKLYNGQWFNEEETTFHIQIMSICGFLCKELKKDASGIAVDPRTKSIVAIGFNENDRHPLMHCAMVLLDAVARSQNGGAWNELLVGSKDNQDATYANLNGGTSEYTQSGVGSHIRRVIGTKFPTVKFGAEHVKTVAENRQNSMELNETSDNLTKYGPYLCTGYDVYLWREPCVMCSMALTHSRIRSIFFSQTQSTGAVSTLTKLQSVKALNHHFQVFHVSGDS